MHDVDSVRLSKFWTVWSWHLMKGIIIMNAKLF